MEIILKKTKITSSILKQTLIANYIDLKTSEFLGWCIHNEICWMVFYKNNSLSKFPKIKKIVETPDNSLLLIVVSGGEQTYTFTSKEQYNDRLKMFKELKHSADKITQFYI